MISVTVIGGAALRAKLKAIEDRGRNPTAALATAGFKLAKEMVPNYIRLNEGGWPIAKSWPRYRTYLRPLWDTGRLMDSLAYVASPRNLKVFTSVPYGKTLNDGATITAAGKFLLLPLSPPLTIEQAKNFPRGKAAIRSAYSGSWFGKGPGGFGIHRYNGDLIAQAVAKVQVPARKWLWWRPKYIALVQELLRAHLMGELKEFHNVSGGNPDVGKR